MANNPRQCRLRKGRISVPGQWYAVTTCVHRRRPLLVGDVTRPLATGVGAAFVAKTFAWLHAQERMHCHAWCVMPDHVHLVLALNSGQSLSSVMNALKSYSARAVNRCLGVAGQVWQRGFYDHALRRDEAWLRTARYVVENPLRRGYVARAEDWPWAGMGPPTIGP